MRKLMWAVPPQPAGACFSSGTLNLAKSGTAITSTFVLLPKLGAVNNAAVLNFEPIAVLGLAWAILGQAVAPLQIAGAFIVVGAIAWMGTGKR